MRSFIILTLLGTILLFTSTQINAQSANNRSSAKATVTVNVLNGEPIKGNFVKADSETVTVDIGSGEAAIKIEKITSIVFQNGNTDVIKVEEKEVKSKEVSAAEKIIAALRRLDNATAVGVTFQNYSALLIEDKSIVDENLKDITNPDFRLSVDQAMLDYQYAMYVWNLAVANNWAIFYTKQEPGRTLINKYHVPIKISVWTQIPVLTGLNYIWLSSRNNFNNASNTLKRMGESPLQ